MKLVMSTSALIGRRPIAASRLCSHSGEGPFLTPRTRRSAKAGHSDGVVPKSSVTVTGQGNAPSTGLIAGSLKRAHVGGGEIAGDAVDAGAVGAVGGEVDVDHRIVELRPFGVAHADRRVVRQVDDAVVIVGNLQLRLRAQHAAAFDAADGADAERDVLSRDEGAGRRRTRPSCRCAHWARRTRPAPDRRRRCRPCRRAAGRHWDAASASITRAIVKGAKRLRLVLDELSTSSPIMVSLSTSRSSGSSVSRCSLSQERVNFMCRSLDAVRRLAEGRNLRTSFEGSLPPCGGGTGRGVSRKYVRLPLSECSPRRHSDSKAPDRW